LAVIAAYLPAPIADDELKKLVEDAVRAVGATSSRDMGKVMNALMPKVKGRADGKKVNEMVKAALGG
jgi:uncharacterized protein